MSIQTELTRITNAKTAIKTAIEGKGVTVPDGTMLDGMAALIESIEAGGGGIDGYNSMFTGAFIPSEDISTKYTIETGLTFNDLVGTNYKLLMYLIVLDHYGNSSSERYNSLFVAYDMNLAYSYEPSMGIYYDSSGSGTLVNNLINSPSIAGGSNPLTPTVKATSTCKLKAGMRYRWFIFERKYGWVPS